MGLFDKLADKAKQAATDVRQAAEKVASEGKNLVENASANGKNLVDKVVADGRNFYDKSKMSAAELSTWAAGMHDKLRKMADDFDAEALWDKLAKTAANAGQELIVMVLTIYYAIESKLPGKDKTESQQSKK